MANSGNKKIIVKKDMNFFAEFTAAAARAMAVRASVCFQPFIHYISLLLQPQEPLHPLC